VRLSKPPRILFLVDNVRIDGTLQRLSVTGGSARINRTCTPGALAEIKINTASGSVEGLVEMLAPLELGDEQPFRFVALGDFDHELLASTITRLRQMGLADGVASSGF
jgi:hypothetical protein